MDGWVLMSEDVVSDEQANEVGEICSGFGFYNPVAIKSSKHRPRTGSNCKDKFGK